MFHFVEILMGRVSQVKDAFLEGIKTTESEPRLANRPVHRALIWEAGDLYSSICFEAVT